MARELQKSYRSGDVTLKGEGDSRTANSRYKAVCLSLFKALPHEKRTLLMALALTVLAKLKTARHIDHAIDLARGDKPEVQMRAIHGFLLTLPNNFGLRMQRGSGSALSQIIDGQASCISSRKKPLNPRARGICLMHRKSSLRWLIRDTGYLCLRIFARNIGQLS